MEGPPNGPDALRVFEYKKKVAKIYTGMWGKAGKFYGTAKAKRLVFYRRLRFQSEREEKLSRDKTVE